MTDRHETPDREEVRRLLELAGPRPSLPEDDLETIRREAMSAWRSETEGGSGTTRSYRRGAGLLGLAAALLIALGLAWWLRGDPRSSTAPADIAFVEVVKGAATASVPHGPSPGLTAGIRLARGTTLETGDETDEPSGLALRFGERVSLRLAAATRVTLRSDSVIELHRGAVYVDTGTGPSSRESIEVRTSLGTATDLGTRFLVDLDPRGEELTVGVREGEVRVRNDARDVVAMAGTRLVVDRAGLVRQRPLSPSDDLWSWTADVAPPFPGGSVAALLSWTSRETGWRIRYATAEAEAVADRTTIQGSIAALPPDEAAFAILPGASLEATLEDDVLVVARPRDSN